MLHLYSNFKLYIVIKEKNIPHKLPKISIYVQKMGRNPKSIYIYILVKFMYIMFLLIAITAFLFSV